MKKRNWVSTALKILVAGGVASFLLARSDLREIGHNLAGLNYLPLAIMLVVQVGGIVLMTFRMQVLMRAQGFPVPFRRMFGMMIVGMFFNNFAPGTVGSDTYRALALRSFSGSGAVAGGAVAMFRLTGIAATLIMVAVGLALNEWVWANEAVLIPVAITFVALALAIVAVFFHPRSLFRWLRRRRPAWVQRLAEKGDRMHEAFALLRGRPGLIALCIGLAVVVHLAWIANAWLLFAAFDRPVSPVRLVFNSSALVMAFIVPFTMATWGGREAIFVPLYEAIGVPTATSTAAAAVSRCFFMLISLSGGCCYWAWQRRSRNVEDTHVIERDCTPTP